MSNVNQSIFNTFTDVYPVEEFKGKVIFTWIPPRIGAKLTTHYDLTCVLLLQGIPSLRHLSLSNTETSAEMSGLYSGVTYNCNISAVTAEGSSQPKNLTLSINAKGKCINFCLRKYRYIPLSCLALSGAPEMFETVPGEREVVSSSHYSAKWTSH